MEGLGTIRRAGISIEKRASDFAFLRISAFLRALRFFETDFRCTLYFNVLIGSSASAFSR